MDLPIEHGTPGCVVDIIYSWFNLENWAVHVNPKEFKFSVSYKLLVACVSVNRRPPEQPQVAHWGRHSRDSTMTSIGEDDGSLNIRPMSRYDTTPMPSKSRTVSKMSMLSLDSNADRTSNA